MSILTYQSVAEKKKKELIARNHAVTHFKIAAKNVRRWYGERDDLRGRSAAIYRRLSSNRTRVAGCLT
jgi:hypothetical protein